MTDYIWYVLTRAYWITRWRLSRMRRRLHRKHRDRQAAS